MQHQQLKDSNVDCESVGSGVSYGSSIFSNEAQIARHQVYIEGKIELMNLAAGVVNTENEISSTFEFYDCSLTKSGRLTVKKDRQVHIFSVEKCSISDDSSYIFELDVSSETSMLSTNSITCRFPNVTQFTKWLIAMEVVEKSREENANFDALCVHGNLEILEYNPKIIYKNATDFKTCYCFFYQNLLRVKGFVHENATVTFKIVKIEKAKESLYPLCFILTTNTGMLLCKCPKINMLTRWMNAIQKAATIHKDQSHSMSYLEIPVARDNSDVKVADLIIFTDESEPVRVKAEYSSITKLLTTELLGVPAETFQILQCRVPCDSQYFDFKFTALNEAKEKIHIYCKAGSTESIKEWIKILSPDPLKLARLLSWTFHEIEFRRICKGERSNKKDMDTEFTSDKLLHILNTITDQHLFSDMVLNKDIWTIKQLEQLVQQIFKIMPGPIIPFNEQPLFLTLGSMQRKNTKDVCHVFTEELFSEIPEYTKRFLEALCDHVNALIPFVDKRRKGITILNKTAIQLWSNFAVYIFRSNEQEIEEENYKDFINKAAHSLEAVRQYFQTVAAANTDTDETQ